jgi:hypothetical protein
MRDEPYLAVRCVSSSPYLVAANATMEWQVISLDVEYFSGVRKKEEKADDAADTYTFSEQ